jgi:outer membrane protein TolC
MNDRHPSFCRSGLLALGLLTAALGPRASADASESLTVSRAVELGLARAPDVAIAFATDAEALASARLAADASRPEAWLTTTPGYSQGLPGAVAGRLPAVAGFEVRQNLYDPARRADALEAQARRSLSRAGVETSKSATAQAVVLAYARCWADEGLVAGAERRLEVSARLRERTEALRREGRATPLDVEKAALQQAWARQARLDRLSDRDLDQLELRRLIGWAPNVPLVLVGDPLASLPDVAPGEDASLARASDPETRGLEEAVRALEGAETLRGRSWAPVVDLAAQYSRLVHYRGYDEFYRAFKADNWSVGLSVVLPLWTGGRTADALARSHASRQRLVAQHRSREAQLELLMRRSEATLGRAVARLSLSRRAQGVAEEELRVAHALAEEGKAGLGDVDARDVAVADAADEVLRAQSELLAARVQLMSLRGELISAVLHPSPGRRPENAGS